MFVVLVDDEESEESGRQFLHGHVHVLRLEVVPEHGVLVAACVISGDEFQFFCTAAFFLLSEVPAERALLVAQVSRACWTYREPRDAHEKHLEARDVVVEAGE
jgi:hypothetical protein